MAVYHTVDGQPYSVTAGTDVTVTDADGLILGVSAGGQGSFVGNGGDVTITGEHHFVQIKGGGGGGNGGGGGGGGTEYIAGDGIQIDGAVISVDTSGGVVEAGNTLPVGGGTVYNALDSVKFDGNLDTDLHVGLQPPTRATGSVQINDVDAAGVLKIGDNPEISIPKWNGVKAYVDLTPYATYYRSFWPSGGYRITYPLPPPAGKMTLFMWNAPPTDAEVRTPQALVDAINGDNDQGQWSPSAESAVFSAKLLPNGKIRLTSNLSGTAGNALVMLSKDLFSEGMTTTFAGGSSDPRPAADVVAQLNTAASAYIDTAKTTYDAVTGTISMEALQAGRNDTIAVVSGDLFVNPQGMSGGSNGKKIYLNEQLLDIGGPPNVVMPETTLPSDNKLQNGHIYLVTANSAEGTDLSALEVVPFAKADIWLEYVSGPVSWSHSWSWVDGITPEGLAAGTRYFIEVFSDGVAEIAKLKYSYTHA